MTRLPGVALGLLPGTVPDAVPGNSAEGYPVAASGAAEGRTATTGPCMRRVMAAEVINAGRAGTSTATAGAAETSGTAGTDTSASAAQTVGLTCHGGAGAARGAAGLAVNARRREPPDRLRAELACTLSGLAAYPDPAPAARAVTARHGRRAGEVLLTAGRAHLTRLPGTVPGVEVGGNQRAPFALIHVADGLRVREGLGRRGLCRAARWHFPRPGSRLAADSRARDRGLRRVRAFPPRGTE